MALRTVVFFPPAFVLDFILGFLSEFVTVGLRAKRLRCFCWRFFFFYGFFNALPRFFFFFAGEDGFKKKIFFFFWLLMLTS